MGTSALKLGQSLRSPSLLPTFAARQVELSDLAVVHPPDTATPGFERETAASQR